MLEGINDAVDDTKEGVIILRRRQSERVARYKATRGLIPLVNTIPVCIKVIRAWLPDFLSLSPLCNLYSVPTSNPYDGSLVDLAHYLVIDIISQLLGFIVLPPVISVDGRQVSQKPPRYEQDSAVVVWVNRQVVPLGFPSNALRIVRGAGNLNVTRL